MKAIVVGRFQSDCKTLRNFRQPSFQALAARAPCLNCSRGAAPAPAAAPCPVLTARHWHPANRASTGDPPLLYPANRASTGDPPRVSLSLFRFILVQTLTGEVR